MPFIAATAAEADTLAIQNALAATQIGDTCTYAQISAAIGREAQDVRYLILRAIHRLNKENGAIFAAVRRIGYKRLSPNEAHQIGSTARARIRRTARAKSANIARALERANDIDPAARRKAIAEISSLNLMEHLATEKMTAKQEGDVPQPPAVTMRELLANLGAR